MIYGDIKELAKDVWTLAKATQNADLQAKTLEMREQMNELIEAAQEKDDQIRELKRLVAFQGTLTFSAGVYFSGSDQTPYCPRCWEQDHTPIHLVVLEDDYKTCPECKNGWGRPPGVGQGGVIRN